MWFIGSKHLQSKLSNMQMFLQLLFGISLMTMPSLKGKDINPFVQISIDYLEVLRDQGDVSDVLISLERIPMSEFINSVDTKEEKLAFWINIYNAHVISLLREDGQYFENKDSFYKERDICIAGIQMSLDEIEHGILRDSRIKWSLGYLQKWFVPGWIKDLRNNEIDGRVHFALNCGAKDCPPVGIYNDMEINRQLNQMTGDYLMQKTVVEGDNVTTSALFSWFRGDFGGKKGIKKFLLCYEVIDDTDVNLSFANYDWTMEIGEIKDITD